MAYNLHFSLLAAISIPVEAGDYEAGYMHIAVSLKVTAEEAEVSLAINGRVFTEVIDDIKGSRSSQGSLGAAAFGFVSLDADGAIDVPFVCGAHTPRRRALLHRGTPTLYRPVPEWGVRFYNDANLVFPDDGCQTGEGGAPFCLHGGTCINGKSRPVCLCLPQYAGRYCERCGPAFLAQCHVQAICSVKSDGQATCTCASGFTGNGTVCTDVERPVLHCKDQQYRLRAGASLKLMAPLVTDNGPEDRVDILCVPIVGTLLSLGTHEIQCTASDSARNEDSCAFTVVATDGVVPMITCPASMSHVLGQDEGVAQFVLPLPSISHPNGTATTFTCDRNGTVTLGVGSHRVTCSARDADGDTASCSYLVTAVDVTEPTLHCPEQATLKLPPSGESLLAALQLLTTASDASNTVSVNCRLQAFSNNSADSAICKARDASGNEATCVIELTLEDVTAPTLECGESRALLLSGDLRDAPPDSVAALLSSEDNFDPNPMITCPTPKPGLGTQTLTCTVLSFLEGANGVERILFC
jgi:hypothetical protein